MAVNFVTDTAKGIIALFIVVDPLGNFPIFMSLTEKISKKARKGTFNTATLVGLILLLCFAIGGDEIFKFFGISLSSFMIAGGILLLIIAIRILISGRWKEDVASPESVGAVPIAVPLLVGPGAITATILILQTSGLLVALTSVLITFGIVWIILRYIEPLYKVLGKTGSIVIARILAMFIAAIAVGYILNGLTAYIHG